MFSWCLPLRFMFLCTSFFCMRWYVAGGTRSERWGGSYKSGNGGSGGLGLRSNPLHCPSALPQEPTPSPGTPSPTCRPPVTGPSVSASRTGPAKTGGCRYDCGAALAHGHCPLATGTVSRYCQGGHGDMVVGLAGPDGKGRAAPASRRSLGCADRLRVPPPKCAPARPDQCLP